MEIPGEQLLIKLNQLQKELNTLHNRLNKSGTARTAGLLDSMGHDCEFYQKSLDIFLRKDYIDLRNLVVSIHNLFNIIEGKK